MKNSGGSGSQQIVDNLGLQIFILLMYWEVVVVFSDERDGEGKLCILQHHMSYLYVLMYVSMYVCINVGTYLCMSVGK